MLVAIKCFVWMRGYLRWKPSISPEICRRKIMEILTWSSTCTGLAYSPPPATLDGFDAYQRDYQSFLREVESVADEVSAFAGKWHSEWTAPDALVVSECAEDALIVLYSMLETIEWHSKLSDKYLLAMRVHDPQYPPPQVVIAARLCLTQAKKCVEELAVTAGGPEARNALAARACR